MRLTWSHKPYHRTHYTAMTRVAWFSRTKGDAYVVLVLLICFLVNGVYSWSCPSDCICLSHTQILCNSGHLTYVPLNELPKTVEHLSLTKNNLTYLSIDAFNGLRSLRKLTLDGNSIHTIEQFAFRGLTRLRELTIQHTPLRALRKFSFSGLQNVTAILLGFNQISVIEEFAFATSANIRLILLNNNPLHIVSAHAFSRLTNVEHLIMPSGIRQIQPDAFNGLDCVGLLKLSFMDLTSLKAHTFRGLSRVHVLAIQDSDLGVIRSEAFLGLTHVGSLNILNNKIDSLQKLVVTRQNQVKHFRFNGNHVLDSPRKGMVDIVALDGFSMMSNHFPCDCHLFRFLDKRPFGRNASTDWFSGKNFCISPLEFNGQPISVVKQSVIDKCLESSSAVSYRYAISISYLVASFYNFLLLGYLNVKL
ncbi:leucine-rich repeat-containing G-protein coupled receptor 4 [Daktulosphaira vitifoliae]|uniref:leucine-rich repeat-containing G-protein coupled receptor 4 n=1 Tax=Daktulosphaira vitifoliae TaxID=58002 RepID=UPI0021AA6AB0|nr:leucine-rich repeat-containing G-protein coupled receptor 4 [Daktulosphaira vitifoliae]